jgi:hypothetical protein
VIETGHCRRIASQFQRIASHPVDTGPRNKTAHGMVENSKRKQHEQSNSGFTDLRCTGLYRVQRASSFNLFIAMLCIVISELLSFVLCRSKNKHGEGQYPFSIPDVDLGNSIWYPSSPKAGQGDSSTFGRCFASFSVHITSLGYMDATRSIPIQHSSGPGGERRVDYCSVREPSSSAHLELRWTLFFLLSLFPSFFSPATWGEVCEKSR